MSFTDLAARTAGKVRRHPLLRAMIGIPPRLASIVANKERGVPIRSLYIARVLIISALDLYEEEHLDIVAFNSPELEELEKLSRFRKKCDFVNQFARV